jgi:hypothetical protein
VSGVQCQWVIRKHEYMIYGDNIAEVVAEYN